MSTRIVSVAVPAPLHQSFDYRVPDALRAALRPGVRVRVPFGRRRVVGVVIEAPREAPPGSGELRLVEAALDAEPLIPPELLELARWAAAYYHHPLGEVLQAALPPGLRAGAQPDLPQAQSLRLTAAGATARAALPTRARAQRELLGRLAGGDVPLAGAKKPAALKTALARGWAEIVAMPPPVVATGEEPALTPGQQAALAELPPDRGFAVGLLEGVTGSGKTELYLRRVRAQLEAGRQALVLVPEIGLTPQLEARFRERFGPVVATYHSGTGERERRHAWLGARSGAVQVIVGTRSAIFVPFARLGLIVVDEEHDVSYKQQEGFRYSARDLALLRAQRLDIPILLGSATPALESLHNAARGRYRRVRLDRRVGGGAPPRVTLLDVRGQPQNQGLSTALLEAVRRHVDQGGQALLFLNRRGYAPVLLCHQCGWIAPCRNCDARPTLHRGRGLLICHHCATQQPAPVACASCGAGGLLAMGHGTERIEEALRNFFPAQRVERFDSDRLARRGELQRLLGDVAAGAVQILVGTQLLAKGHDFAGVSLVGIVDTDHALHGTDFRAVERMGQLVTQVAGRAGRVGQQAEVLLQTHQPSHPLLQALVRDGYPALCEQLLAERRDAGLPPFSRLALLRAEAVAVAAPLAFLREVRALAVALAANVRVSEPVPAPMERRAGRTRAQLLLQAAARQDLQRLLAPLVAQAARLPAARRVRWSVDVDPADLF